MTRRVRSRGLAFGAEDGVGRISAPPALDVGLPAGSGDGATEIGEGVRDLGSGEGVTDRPRTAEVLLRFAPFQSRRRKLRVRVRPLFTIRDAAGDPAGEIAFATDDEAGVSAGLSLTFGGRST